MDEVREDEFITCVKEEIAQNEPYSVFEQTLHNCIDFIARYDD